MHESQSSLIKDHQSVSSSLVSSEAALLEQANEIEKLEGLQRLLLRDSNARVAALRVRLSETRAEREALENTKLFRWSRTARSRYRQVREQRQGTGIQP